MATKFGKVVTYNMVLSLIKLRDSSIVFVNSRDKLFYISTCTRPMATKHGKVVGDLRLGPSTHNFT